MKQSTRAITAIAFMIEAPNKTARIATGNMRKDRRLGASVCEIRISFETGEVIEGSLTPVLSAIRGGAIGHYRQPEIAKIVSTALETQGLFALDNPLRDFSHIVSEHLSGRFSDALPDLPSLAFRHGLRPAEVENIHTDPMAGLNVVAQLYKDIWARLSGFSGAIQEDAGPEYVSPHDAYIAPLHPVPAPDLPSLDTPPGGWRRSDWTKLEQQALARDFSLGKPMEALSRSYRRSPRAILARLTLDGVTQK